MDKTTLERRVLSSNEWGLIAILHEGLMERFEEAAGAVEKNDFEELNKITNNGRDKLEELLINLRGKDELSTNLRSLYLFTNELITEGEIKKDSSCFKKAINIINPLYSGFKALENKEKPNIVSGLVYGKNDVEDFQNSEKVFKG